MNAKQRIPALLQAHEYVSGSALARELGVSRAAIHKAICALREEGCEIEASSKLGYRLLKRADLLDGDTIATLLPKGTPFGKISVYEKLESSNSLLRSLADAGEPAGSVVICAEQSGGRGRRGRSFFSPRGAGLYMSILLRPDCSAADAALLTSAAAVAVCEAIESVCGLEPKIKWVNDIFLGGKKVCGILTEAAIGLESGMPDYAVVGIGLNVYPPEGGYPPQIEQIAGYISGERVEGLKNRLAAAILEKFSRYCSDPAARGFTAGYERRCFVIGKRVTVISPGGEREALALGVEGDCRLLVRYDDGSEQALGSGEISIKSRDAAGRE